MTKLSLALLTTSTLLAGSTLAATTCKVDITPDVLALVNNATYLNTCSPGSTWKLNNLFEAANLSSADFLTFCNVSKCVDPLHAFFDLVPEHCIATYNGSAGKDLMDSLGFFYYTCHGAVNTVDGLPTTKSLATTTPGTHATIAVTVGVIASTIAALVL